MKAKLINSQLQYASTWMQIGEDWVSNPTDEMLIQHGYKVVIVPQITETQKLGGFVETADSITYEVIELTEDETAERAKALIPDKITSRQLRSALIMSGIKLAMIDTIISTLPQPQQDLARVDWEYSTNFYRNNTMINQIAGALKLTSEQVDEIFIQGENLINDN